MNDIQAVRAEARRQLEKEQFDEAVRLEKERIRQHRPWWQLIFPFEITIRRKTWEQK
jgi:hypothetical protein